MAGLGVLALAAAILVSIVRIAGFLHNDFVRWANMLLFYGGMGLFLFAIWLKERREKA